MSNEPVRANVLIGGRHRESPYAPVRNPANTREVVGESALGTAADVDAAVGAAHAAFGEWSRLPAAERAERITAAAAALGPETEDRARLLTREQGKVGWEARLDVGGAAHILGYYAGLAERIDEETVFREDERGTVLLRRAPMGPTGVIVPWNSPVYLAFLAVAPALMAGNTVVVKPSEFAPLALCRILEAVAGHLPDGVVNIVPGEGGEAGAALAGHPLVRKLLFTGSTATGRSIMRAAAGNLKSVSMELGGNDPAIVLESAKITDELISGLVTGVFTGTGQICFNVKRIYVHESRFAEFVDRYTEAVDHLVVGDGLDPRSTMGPLNNAPQFEKVTALIDNAKRSRATVRTVGRRIDGAAADGYFVLPSVVTGLEPGAELVACEQFGPVVPVLPFREEAEAVRMANDSEYGLASSVWSDDRAHARSVARRIEAGSVFVNAHRIGASDVTMPFGGFKGSGLGRSHGFAAVEECTEPQTIADYVDTSHFPGPPRES